jgi:HNH endonuclease
VPSISRCAVKRCPKERHTREWCLAHYKKWQRYGDPEWQRPSIEDRFWSRVDRSGGPEACWPWQGHRNQGGYGEFAPARGQRWMAHRYSYTQLVGPIPQGKQLDHFRCDNPPCCNPRHLRPTTAWENVLRSNSVAAVSAAKTHCPKGHPYDDENTMRSGNRRSCRECKRESYRQWRARNLEDAKAADAAAHRERRAKYPERTHEADRRRYAKNRERFAAEARERRARKRSQL